MKSLAEGIRALADLVGKEIVDYRDEHERWPIYLDALNGDDPRAKRALFEIMPWETDEHIHLSVVLHMLEQVSRNERPTWVERLSDECSIQYARARADDIVAMETILTEGLADGVEQALETGSNWLQLHLAKRSECLRALEELSTSGRTKRIRRTAKEQIAKLRDSMSE
ncbi:hypothetical protein [Sphaerimonospora thailandensis]|uniref:Uncharacterized protein n=1 Tax=Sphaerimonospora thailandensis TaxID=795644 RepID=A0A8J3VZH5_9ACTN|nr:hypothetical protein [Sphaerimonospora thailandensis]GIH70068.1 hypothetical protein Mth01_23210 [Sphaerimonospora thailandensis]